jgi:hypothetical protein
VVFEGDRLSGAEIAPLPFAQSRTKTLIRLFTGPWNTAPYGVIAVSHKSDGGNAKLLTRNLKDLRATHQINPLA